MATWYVVLIVCSSCVPLNSNTSSHSPRRTGGPQAPASGALVNTTMSTTDDARYTSTAVTTYTGTHVDATLVVCVRVFFPFILDIKFVGQTSRGHTGGRSHRISHPPSFCGARLNFSREKDSAVPFPRRP